MVRPIFRLDIRKFDVIPMDRRRMSLRIVLEQICPAQPVTVKVVQGDFVQIDKAPVNVGN